MAEKYAVVDLEATQLTPGPIRERYIIQIGITFIEDKEIINSLTIDVHPPITISDEIIALTGITNEQVETAPAFEDIADYLLMLLEDHTFVAHNVAFDYKLLKEEFDRLGLAFEMPCLDTIDLASMVYPQEQQLSLAHLTSVKKIPLEDHHNAGSDALATAQLFLTLLEDLKGLPQRVGQAVSELLAKKASPYAAYFTLAQGKDKKRKWKRPKETVSQEESPFEMPQLIPYCTERKLNKLIDQEGKVLVLSDSQKIRKRTNVATYYPLEAFVDLDAVAYYQAHEEELSLSETYQLARVMVWLSLTQTGVLSQVISQARMKKRLSTSNPLNPFYQRQLFNLQNTHKLVLSLADYIQSFETLSQLIPLKEYSFIVDNSSQINEDFLELATLTFDFSEDINYLLASKSRLINQGLPSLAVEKVLSTYFYAQYRWLDDQKIEELPVDEEEKVSIQDFYLGALDKLDVKPLLRIKKVLDQQLPHLALIDKFLADHLTLKYARLVDMLAHQKQGDYYAFVTLKQEEGIKKISLSLRPVHSKGLVKHYIYQQAKKVIFIERFGLSLPMVNLLQKSSLPPVTFKPSKGQQKHYIGMYAFLQDSASLKENLLVRKVAQLAAQRRGPIVYIVPNQTVAEKIKDFDESVLVLGNVQSKRIWDRMEEGKMGIVVTLKQFLALDLSQVRLAAVVLLKLPFDPLSNMQAEAIRDLLSPRNYFDEYSLPQMVLTLKRICSKITYPTRFYCADTRLIQSTYQEKIRTLLGNSYVIIDKAVVNETEE